MIKDVATLKKIVPTVTGKNFDKYEPYVVNAVDWMRGQIAGKALMTEILAMTEAEPRPEIYSKAQRVVAYRAYLESISPNDLLETDNGFAVVNDERLAPASTARVETLRKSIASLLSNALDEFIEYLEDSDEYHGKWSTAPSFTIMYGSYLPTKRLFQRYGVFTGNYQDFIAAAPRIRGIMLSKIEPRISRELSTEILSQIRDRDVSADNKVILDDLRTALTAYYNDDSILGDVCVNSVRNVLLAEPDKYPAFKGSEIYKLATMEPAENKHKSILSMV